MERRAANITGISLLLLYLLIFGVLLVTTGEDVIFTSPNVGWLRILYVPMFLGLAMAAFTTIAWRQSYWKFWGRLHYTLLTLASLGFAWFLWFWNICP